MAKRLLRYVGRSSGASLQTLEDGTVVHLNEVVEVDIHEARALLRDPGAPDANRAEWIPEPRSEA